MLPAEGRDRMRRGRAVAGRNSDGAWANGQSADRNKLGQERVGQERVGAGVAGACVAWGGGEAGDGARSWPACQRWIMPSRRVRRRTSRVRMAAWMTAMAPPWLARLVAWARNSPAMLATRGTSAVAGAAFCAGGRACLGCGAMNDIE